MTEADLEDLRRAGFGEPAIHAAIQVVAYFNYVNRVADAVRVDLEPGMPPYPPPLEPGSSPPPERPPKRAGAPDPRGRTLPQ
jgi:hypothetical protein